MRSTKITFDGLKGTELLSVQKLIDEERVKKMLSIAVFNFKGGSAKTTTAVNLAAYLALKGNRTLLIDLDGQRSSSFHLGLDGKAPTSVNWLIKEEISPIATTIENLYLIPGDIRLFDLDDEGEDLIASALNSLKPDFDYCLIDCSPGLTSSNTQALLNCDRILIPVICQLLTVKGLSEALFLIRRQKPEAIIDVVRVRHRANVNEYKEGEQMLLDSEEQYNLLSSVIPENTAVSSAVKAQTSVLISSPRSTGAKAYSALGKEYLELIHSKS